MPKYFYVCTDWEVDKWTTPEGYLVDALENAKFIGTKYWPYTRREARLRHERHILQFDRQTLKFIKEVK